MTTTWRDVIAGPAPWSCEPADALAFLRELPTRSVSLVLFSPPYESQRSYSVGFKLKGQGWVDWMRPIVVESARVSDGLVVVNAAGPVVRRSYSPTMEWLVADLTRIDGLVCGPAPWCWDKVCGIPGSGSKDYQRRDWEPLYAFALPDRLPLWWSDNTAFGHPPKCGPGGEMSNRNKDGTRVNDPWKTASRGGMGCGGRRRNGEKMAGPKDVRRVTAPTSAPAGDFKHRAAVLPKMANPGNVIRARVGGGHIGNRLAHGSEAPMHLAVAERIVCWFAPPGAVVCDPFAGSGTTGEAARRHNRRFVGCDLRDSQVDLTARRLATVTPNTTGA